MSEQKDQPKEGREGEVRKAETPEEMVRVARQEIRKSLSLLEEGLNAAAAICLQRVKWDLDAFLGNREDTPWTWVRVHR